VVVATDRWTSEPVVFAHREPTYYFFGLRAGLANLAANGLRLGLRKTAGKITQPINAFSRFPEYYSFDVAIQRHLGLARATKRRAVLDVGSPKLFGLYLANRFDLDVVLTDITSLNIHEYRVMWRALADRARGRAAFLLQDGRDLSFEDGSFDIVYSMSVLEHIEGKGGDSRAITELVRVLKPGGLLVVSVPFGPTFLEQQRVGFAGAARKTKDRETYFFQRIYDRHQFTRRLVEPVQNLEDLTLTTLIRRHASVARGVGRLGENVRGVLGFMNPLLSAALVRIVPGIDDSFPTQYGLLHSASDVYGDLVLTGRKR
jgi:SAM-dependent methyltransferase